MNVRRYLAAAILAGYAALHSYGAYAFSAPLRYCFAFYGVACAVGAFALVRPRFWARRYAMGIALAGLFNCVAYFAYFRSFGNSWLIASQFGVFAALFALLVGKGMRAKYDELAPHWQFDHPTMHFLGAALSLNVAGVGMLVYYASIDGSWTTTALRGGALSLALALAIGSIFAARGRIAGLLLMTAAGVASLWLGLRAYENVAMPSAMGGYCGEWVTWQTWGTWETVKSVAGFAPAALGSVLCFGVFLGPMIRFVRNRRA